MLDEANIPFSPVRTPSDLFDDPQLNAFGRALAVRMPKGNVANLPSLPFCIDDEAPALRMQPPAAGEHYRRDPHGARLYCGTDCQTARRQDDRLAPTIVGSQLEAHVIARSAAVPDVIREASSVTLSAHKPDRACFVVSSLAMTVVQWVRTGRITRSARN